MAKGRAAAVVETKGGGTTEQKDEMAKSLDMLWQGEKDGPSAPSRRVWLAQVSPVNACV